MGLFANWNVTGVWTGQYRYDFASGYKKQPQPIAFKLVARQGWFGRISGIIQDDPMSGIDKEASVVGRLTDSGLRFQKHHAAVYMNSGSGCISLRDYLKSQGLELDVDVRPAPIEYSGEYDNTEETIKGTWFIREYVLRFSCGGKPSEFQVPRFSGTWFVRREFGLG